MTEENNIESTVKDVAENTRVPLKRNTLDVVKSILAHEEVSQEEIIAAVHSLWNITNLSFGTVDELSTRSIIGKKERARIKEFLKTVTIAYNIPLELRVPVEIRSAPFIIKDRVITDDEMHVRLGVTDTSIIDDNKSSQ